MRDAAEKREETERECLHPVSRQHWWRAADGIMCGACNDCGAVLAGEIRDDLREESEEMNAQPKREDARHIDAKEVAKMIRLRLKEEFSLTKFSVRTERRGTINICWQDGPPKFRVSAIVKQYESKGFDGMIDLSYSWLSWLSPDGTAITAHCAGTTGSVPPISNPKPCADAELVDFGAGYIFTHRDYSAKHEAEAIARFESFWGVEYKAETLLSNTGDLMCHRLRRFLEPSSEEEISEMIEIESQRKINAADRENKDQKTKTLDRIEELADRGEQVPGTRAMGPTYPKKNDLRKFSVAKKTEEVIREDTDKIAAAHGLTLIRDEEDETETLLCTRCEKPRGSMEGFGVVSENGKETIGRGGFMCKACAKETLKTRRERHAKEQAGAIKGAVQRLRGLVWNNDIDLGFSELDDLCSARDDLIAMIDDAFKPKK